MSNFLEIEHIPLRTYNRCAYIHNLYEDAGKAAVEDYLGQLSYRDRLEMITMTKLVKKLGTKRVKDMVTHGLTFSNDDYKPLVEDDFPKIVPQVEGTFNVD